MKKTPIERAVAKYGSMYKMAKKLGITQPAVTYWVNTKGQPPAEYVLQIEADTGVSRHDLRPDIYPRSDVA